MTANILLTSIWTSPTILMSLIRRVIGTAGVAGAADGAAAGVDAFCAGVVAGGAGAGNDDAVGGAGAMTASGADLGAGVVAGADASAVEDAGGAFSVDPAQAFDDDIGADTMKALPIKSATANKTPGRFKKLSLLTVGHWPHMMACVVDACLAAPNVGIRYLSPVTGKIYNL
jgi:hypothetical protein